jgi:hypothetical protein
MIREQDARFLLDAVKRGDCASLIGLSNMGKSTLLRELFSPAIRDHVLRDRRDDWLYVYVDCNLMTERSEQALHETTLRSLLGGLRRTGALSPLLERLNEHYQQVIQPSAPIRSPLAFDDAIRDVCEQLGRALVVTFDEFDDPFERLAGRAYLNLRALKDQFDRKLIYITATERPLSEIRQDDEASEFIELFATRERWIGMLNEVDARTLAQELAEGAPLNDEDLAFILNEAGGHSGLLEAVVDTWRNIAAGSPQITRGEALSLVKQALGEQPNVRGECIRLWSQLSEAERSALMAHVSHLPADKDVLAQLRARRLLNRDGDHDPSDVLVGEIWRAFVKRQSLTLPDTARGVQVDVDSGEVYVDGRRVEPLTELEYKLLLLLYGRLNKIVDKYMIVTNVWGETYLDSVDDARIEKLISRLRSKLEPGAEEPHYLTTLRGRGYKLIG